MSNFFFFYIYIKNDRITNTKSITKYINGFYKYETEKLDKKKKMEYEMILGLRKTRGIDLEQFKQKYNIEITEVFKIDNLLKKGELIIKDNHLKIAEDYLYVSNDILINFIDI